MASQHETGIEPVVVSLGTVGTYITADVLGNIYDSYVLWGAPGVGKTEWCEQLPALLKAATGSDWGLKNNLRNTQVNELDYRGLPHTVEYALESGETKRETIWIPPNFLPNVERDGERGVFVIDEGFAGTRAVQAAMMQLVNERCLGDYVLPEKWVIILLSNRQKDKSHVQTGDNFALLNRFLHFEIKVCIKEWTAWASANNIDERYIAFLNMQPGYLHEFPDGFGTDAKGRTAWASPRTNVKFARRLPHGFSDGDLRNVGAACVGRAIADEVCNFLYIYGSLPDLNRILADPSNAELPIEPSIVWAMCGRFAHIADANNFGHILCVLERLSEEYADCCIRMAVNRDPGLRYTEHFIEFIANNQHLHF